MMRRAAGQPGGFVDSNQQDDSTRFAADLEAKKGSDWGDRWWVRYPLAVGIIIAAVWLLEANPKMREMNQILIGASGIVYPLILMRELSGALIVAAIAYWFFGIVAALPVGVAIIIGALIIANSRH